MLIGMRMEENKITALGEIIRLLSLETPQRSLKTSSKSRSAKTTFFEKTVIEEADIANLGW